MSAFYQKNLPPFERWLRLLGGGLLALVAFWQLGAPWDVVGLAAGLGLALSGVVGFCPACAMVGRKLRS
jgi:hypothetical protein